MKKLNRIYIEITNTCNMSCSFCIKNSRKPKLMTTTEFEKITLDVKKHTKYIYLHVLGEPLSHPNIKEILDIAKQHDMYVNITTNGTLLKKNETILLNNSSVRKISISLHSIEEGSINDNYTYLENVSNFVKKASLNNIICELRLWNINANDEYNKQTVQPLFKLLDIIDTSSITQNLLTCESIKLSNNLYLGKSNRFIWPSLDLEIINEPTFCHAIRSQLAILSDGTVVPCCLDSKGDIILGNIFNNTIEEILSSPKARSIYDGFSNSKAVEELCKRCDYATRFNK